MLEEWGVMVNHKRHLNPTSVDSQGQHSSIYVSLSLWLFVCLFVVFGSVFVCSVVFGVDGGRNPQSLSCTSPLTMQSVYNTHFEHAVIKVKFGVSIMSSRVPQVHMHLLLVDPECYTRYDLFPSL